MASIPAVLARIGIIASVLLLGLVVSGPLTMPILAAGESFSFPTVVPANPEVVTLPDELNLQGSGPVVSTDASKLVELEVKEWHGAARSAEPVVNGIPLPQGAVTSLSQLQVLTLSGSTYSEIPSQFEIITKWPDNSYKWVQVMFFADVTANSASYYFLHYGPQVNRLAAHPTPLTKVETSSLSILSTGPYELGIDKTKTTLFDYVKVNNQFVIPSGSTARGFYFTDDAGTSYDTRNAPTSYVWEEDGPLTKLLRVRGFYKNASGQNYFSYVLRVRFFAGTSRVDTSMVFENRGAAPRAGTAAIGINYSNHKWFKEGYFKTDVSMASNKSLELTPAYSVSNYSSGTYMVMQDAMPSRVDHMALPTFSGTNADSTISNLLDNAFVKIRGPQGATPDALVYSAGPSNFPVTLVNNPNVQYAPGSILWGGPFKMSDGTKSMRLAYKNFFEHFPKSFSVSTPSAGSDSVFQLNFFPLDTSYDDLVHDQGPLHFSSSSSPTDFFGWGGVPCTNPAISNCNRTVPRTTTSYNILSGKAHREIFSLSFDPSDVYSASTRATAFQHPLIAMAPAAYYGPSFSNAFTDPLYIEARDWSNTTFDSDTTKNAVLRTASTLTDKWGRSIWDDASVCNNPNDTCYPMNKIRYLGSGYNNGIQHLGMWIYGEFDWDGSVTPLHESYSHLESANWHAMRSRDSRGITEFDADHYGVLSTWRFNSIANAPPAGMVYQKGDYWIGSESSQRHSLYPGLVMRALLTNDRDLRESILMGASRPAGFYGFVSSTGEYDLANGKTLAQTLANPPWVTELVYMNPYYGSGYPGKAVRNLIWLYDLTGNVDYITLSKGWITNVFKPWVDGCHTKYGTYFFVDVQTTVPNWQTTCPLRFDNGTWSGSQIWQDGYLIQPIIETLERDKTVTGTYDPVLHSWILQVLQNQISFIYPFVPAQVTPYTKIFDGPNKYAISTTANLSAAQAQAICGTGYTVGNPAYNDPGMQPLTAGTIPATLVTCWHTYNFTSTYLYLSPGMTWLYHQTADPSVLNFLKIQFRDTLMFAIRGAVSFPYPINSAAMPAEAPSHRLGLGATDLKAIASVLHDAHPFIATFLYPTGSVSLPPSVIGLSPNSVVQGSSGSFTISGNNFSSNAVVIVGSGASSQTITPSSVNTSVSPNQIIFSLSSTQVSTLLGSNTPPFIVPVQVSQASQTSNAVNLTIQSSTGSPPQLSLQSPASNAIFTQGNPITFSATVSTSTATTTTIRLYRRLGSAPTLGPTSPDLIHSTTIATNSTPVLYSHTDNATSTQTPGIYYWQIDASITGQFVQSPIVTYTLNASTVVCSPLTQLCANQQGVCANSMAVCSNGSFSACTANEYGPGYELVEVSCQDGSDNDCDGAADCSDLDCVSASACQVSPVTCGDYVCDNTTGETCLTCTLDCLACNPNTATPPTGNPGGSGGGGGGGGGGGSGSGRGAAGSSGGNSSNSLGGESGSINSSDDTPELIKSNPALSFMNNLGASVVGAVSTDAAQNYAINLAVSIVLLMGILAAAAYFMGFI